MKKIKDLPGFQRPREKLLNVGVSNLNDEELLMAILGSGTQRFPVRQLAAQLLQKFPNKALTEATPAELNKIPGLGQAQVSKLIAACELGRRLFQPSSLPRIMSREDVLRELIDIRHKPREHLVGLYLNARNELVHKETITIGGLNYNSLQPRDVFLPALKHPCAAIILAHNHPSGDTTPSQEDRDITIELKQAGELLGITLIEHLIVGPTTHFSL